MALHAGFAMAVGVRYLAGRQEDPGACRAKGVRGEPWLQEDARPDAQAWMALMIEPIDDALAAWEQVLTEFGSPGYVDPPAGAAVGAEGADAVGCGVEFGRAAGVPVAARVGVALGGLTVCEGCASPGAGGEEGDGVARLPSKPAGSTNGAGLADCPAMAGARSAARFTPASSGRKAVTARTAIVTQARPTAATASFGPRPVA